MAGIVCEGCRSLNPQDPLPPLRVWILTGPLHPCSMTGQMQERSSPLLTSKYPWCHISDTLNSYWWAYCLGGSPHTPWVVLHQRPSLQSGPSRGVREGAPACWELTCPVAPGSQTSAGHEQHCRSPSWLPLLFTCSWRPPVAQPCLVSSCFLPPVYPPHSCTHFQVRKA